MIDVERLRDLRQADPFVPFAPHPTDGGRFRATGPEHSSVSPDPMQVVAGDPVQRLEPDQVANEEVGLEAPPGTERPVRHAVTRGGDRTDSWSPC